MHKIALLPKAGVCPTATMPDGSPSEIVLVVRNLLLISNLKLLIARPDLFIYYCYLVQILLSWERLWTAFCSVTISLVVFITLPYTRPWAVLVSLRKRSSPSSPCGTPPCLLCLLSVLWGLRWPRRAFPLRWQLCLGHQYSTHSPDVLEIRHLMHLGVSPLSGTSSSLLDSPPCHQILSPGFK